MRAAFPARSRQRVENAGKGIREMFKIKTDGMSNLKGQEMREVQMKETLNAYDYVDSGKNIEAEASENATKADVEYYINQHNTAADAHAAILKKKSEFVKVTIPNGRMRGDINNDGVIDEIDLKMLEEHMNGKNRITEKNALECADVNGDTLINSGDRTCIQGLISGSGKYGKYGYFSDILHNWAANENYENENYQFTVNINVKGLTKENSAIIFVPDYSFYEVITKVECDENILRIYVTRCPISKVEFRVQIFEGDGSADFVYSGDPVFIKNSTITIPKGRMRGDVNGDGKVDYTDASLIADYRLNKIDIIDADAVECLDADDNGDVNSNDENRVRGVADGYIKYGLQTDISGIWMRNPEYTSEDGQFYTDIIAGNVTEHSSVVLFVPDHNVYEILVKAECHNGSIRIYAARCPNSDIECKVQIFEGDSSVEIVYSGGAVTDTNFVVTITNDEEAEIYSADCSFASIKNAYQSGRNVILHYDEASYFLSSIDDRYVCFARIYTNISASEMVIESFLIRGEGIAKYFRTVVLASSNEN